MIVLSPSGVRMRFCNRDTRLAAMALCLKLRYHNPSLLALNLSG